VRVRIVFAVAVVTMEHAGWVHVVWSGEVAGGGSFGVFDRVIG
jgi:hypothetical protein